MRALLGRLQEVICAYCPEKRTDHGCQPTGLCPGTEQGHALLLDYCRALSIIGQTEREIDPRIRKALELIDQNWQSPIRARDLCKSVGVSHSRFRSLFKKQTGVSFREYLTLRRLREATLLLSKTNLPVTEICFQVGWSDLSNFERTFRRRFGISPRALRCGKVAERSARGQATAADERELVTESP